MDDPIRETCLSDALLTDRASGDSYWSYNPSEGPGKDPGGGPPILVLGHTLAMAESSRTSAVHDLSVAEADSD